jgi:hypothetical protein
MSSDGNGGGGASGVAAPGVTRGGKINTFNENIGFLRSKTFNSFSQVK